MIALLPTGVLLVGAFAALLLEAAGAAPGFRKRAERAHLPWLVGLFGVGAIGAALLAYDERALDGLGALGATLACGLVVLAHAASTSPLRALDEERGEMSAAFLLLGGGACAMVASASLVSFTGGLALVVVAGALLAAPDREGPHGIEAAARLVVTGLVLVALLAFAAALTLAATGELDAARLSSSGASPAGRAALALVMLVLLSLLGAVPLHPRFVDTAHGSSSSSSGLLAGVVFAAGGVFAVRVLASGGAAMHAAGRADVAALCAGLAFLTLVGAPLAALAQIRVGRLAAYLCATQAGVLLVALSAGSGRASVVVIVTGAIASASSLLGVTLATRHPAATWEDWAGYGRARPVVAALFIYALATCAGMPGTPGFLARLDVARAAFAAGSVWLGLVTVASTAVAAAPVVRLALFLFAKERTSSRTDGTAPAFAFVAGVGVLALFAAVPDLLRALASLAG